MKKPIKLTFLLLYFGIVTFAQDMVIGSPEEVYSPGFLSGLSSGVDCDNSTADLHPWISGDCGWPLEWLADGIICHVKKNDNTVITFWPTPNRIQRYEGPINNLRDDYDAVTPASSSLYHFGPPAFQSSQMYFSNAEAYFDARDFEVAIYLHNIYKTDDNGLIGFTHIEKFEEGAGTDQRQYSIGIAYSSNMGDTWTFCGEIITTEFDGTGADYNIEGVP
jgi:hypothetical protein